MFLPYTTDLVTALGWAILHSLWQALLVFACLRIVLRLWPNATSGIKYNLSFLSLAGIFGWFLVTMYRQLAAISEVHDTIAWSGAAAAPAAPLHLPAVYQRQQELVWMFPNLETSFPILVALYIAGVGVMCIKLAADLAQLRQIRKRQVLPADMAWEHYLARLTQQLQIPRKVKLLVSRHIQVPVMIGFLKPVILLPVAMFNNLSAEQLEAILLHELAHIKRNDYLLNIFQSIVETALFFNPFVWWISRYVRQEREHCCDDMVIAHNIQPLHYAKALVALEEYRFTTNPMVMAAADNKQHLFYRIKRIMEMKTSHLNYTQKLMAMLIIAVGLTAIAWITPSAKEDHHSAAPAATPAPVVSSTAAPAIARDTVPPATGGRQETSDTNDVTEGAANPPADAMQDAQEEMRAAQEKMRAAQEASLQAVQEAMRNIDWQQINAQTEQALKAVDWKKINEQIAASMKAIDWNKINAEVDAAVKESANVDPEMIRQSVELGLKSAQTALAAIDLEKIIKQSMQHIPGPEERAAIRQEMATAREAQREAMAEARAEIEKARAEMQNAHRSVQAAARAETNARRHARRAEITHKQYKTLLEKMEADKLIDRSKPFTIEKKDGQLYINGNRQPDSVLDKYRPYLNASEITIKGSKDNLNVNVND